MVMGNQEDPGLGGEERARGVSEENGGSKKTSDRKRERRGLRALEMKRSVYEREERKEEEVAHISEGQATTGARL